MSQSRVYPSEDQAKADLVEMGRRMYQKNFVAAHDGNLSCLVGENQLWITPTAVSKGYMTPEMLVKTDLEGKVLAGTSLPSSELKMHLRVYKENPAVLAVVHAHPPIATAFSIVGLPLERPILAEAIVQLGKVPIAPYAKPGTQEVPEVIAPYCREYKGLLLAHHGALTWGESLLQAYFRMETLEYYATLLMYTDHMMGQAQRLSPAQVEALAAD